MTWKFTDPTNTVVFRLTDAGTESLLVTSPEVQQWIDAGNEPEPADPVSLVPASVSPAQAKLALLGAGLLDQAETAATADRATQIAWEEATSFERDSPTVATLAVALALTDEQVDDLFIAAAAIRI